MKYEDRKLCGIINSPTINSPTSLNLRCPLNEDKAKRTAGCDGCELFEIHLRFRARSLEQLRRDDENQKGNS